jgi:hypothetical protein
MDGEESGRKEPKMPTMKPFLKRWTLMPMLMALLLSACSPSTALSAGSATTTERAAQLALGTVRLEGTEQAVDATAAAQLLPLWELLSDLRTSSTAAPEELVATVQAIEAAMTTDQLAAIEAMELPTAEASGAGPAPGDVESAQAVAAPMDPAMGGEAMAAMGGDMPMDGGMPPDGSGQAQAGNSTTGRGSSNSMYREVIALLQSKTGS